MVLPDITPASRTSRILTSSTPSPLNLDVSAVFAPKKAEVRLEEISTAIIAGSGVLENWAYER
jgi:hypothetical protein